VPPPPAQPPEPPRRGPLRIVETAAQKIARLEAALVEKDAAIDRLSQAHEELAGDYPPPVSGRYQEIKIPHPPAAPQETVEYPGRPSIAVRAGRAIRDKPLIVHLLTLVLSGGGATAITTAISSSKPEPADSGAQAYGQLAPAFEKFSAEQRAWNEAQSKQTAYILGVLEASGYKITRPEGVPIPQRVEIKATPAPAAAIAPVLAAPRPGAAPRPARIEVLTEPPALPKAPDLVKLPETLQ
jgi:hypothetical protein